MSGHKLQSQPVVRHSSDHGSPQSQHASQFSAGAGGGLGGGFGAGAGGWSEQVWANEHVLVSRTHEIRDIRIFQNLNGFIVVGERYEIYCKNNYVLIRFPILNPNRKKTISGWSEQVWANEHVLVSRTHEIRDIRIFQNLNGFIVVGERYEIYCKNNYVLIRFPILNPNRKKTISNPKPYPKSYFWILNPKTNVVS